MPELPEVETVRRSLEQLVLGKTIAKVDVRWPKIIKHPQEYEQFQDALPGQTIGNIGRKGKFLIFGLQDYSLVSHLRMEGNYRLHAEGDERDKHTHIIFSFTDGTELHYRDVRKFGTMHLFAKGTEHALPPLAKLGPEPFSASFTGEYLREKFGKTARSVKNVLLDQTIVTGLGNIYVDEVLFRSRVHPERKASSLSEKEIERIRNQASKVLADSIESGGSSVNTYMNAHGLTGTYQEKLQVYGRKGEPCPECGTPIEKIKVGGRGTHFCPECQPF